MKNPELQSNPISLILNSHVFSSSKEGTYVNYDDVKGLGEILITVVIGSDNEKQLV